MLSGMIDRFLLTLLTLLVLATAGAIFLLAPILLTLAVSVMLIGLIAMFWLGLHVAKPPTETSSENSDEDENDWNLSEHAR